jgi:hypothetical protein
MTPDPKKYVINSKQMYIASRASYGAYDRYLKFAYFNVEREGYKVYIWIPGVMNQHGKVIDLSLIDQEAPSSAKGFAHLVSVASMGLTGVTAIVLLAGVPLLILFVGIIITG